MNIRWGTVALALLASACVYGESLPASSSPPSIPTSPPQTTGSLRATSQPPSTVPATDFEAETPIEFACAEGTLAGDSQSLLAFFAVCGFDYSGLRPVYRSSNDSLTLDESLDLLVGGTTQPEQDSGLGTGFDQTADPSAIEVETSLQDGTLAIAFTLDGDPWNPGPLTATAYQLFTFLDPLYATVFAFPEVEAIDLGETCWGEMGCGISASRWEWEGGLLRNEGVLLHRECTYEVAYQGDDRCTVAGQDLIGEAKVMVPDGDYLNVRWAPSADAETSGTLGPNVTIDVLEPSEISADGGLWRLVELPDHELGWVNSAYLEFVRTPQEAALESLIAFAKDPTTANFDSVPLADEVALGLSQDIRAVIGRSDLRDRQAWTVSLDDTHDDAYDLLAAAERWDTYRIETGAHPHCAGSPIDPPEGYEDHVRVSAQPVIYFPYSCLAWSTIDIFLNDDGQINAVTIDQWEW